MSDTDYAEITKNTAEFNAYALIATTGGIEGLRSLINVDWSADYNEDEKALIKEAINIRSLIMSKNTCKFFRILRKGETNYFFACLMLITMQRMRCQGIEQFMKVTPMVPDYSLIMKQLNLSSVE